MAKNCKIGMVGLLLLATLLVTAFTAQAGELRPMNLFINLEIVDFDVPVVYENYMPYLPLRYICEALHIPLSYDPAVRAVFVDGKMLEEPYLYYGRDVYVSLERVEEVLGLEVGLDGEYEMISLYTPLTALAAYIAYDEYTTPYWEQGPPPTVAELEAMLKDLEIMRKMGLITEERYKALKSHIEKQIADAKKKEQSNVPTSSPSTGGGAPLPGGPPPVVLPPPLFP